jgi:hypothetical protein
MTISGHKTISTAMSAEGRMGRWRTISLEWSQEFLTAFWRDAWFVVWYISKHVSIHVGRVAWYVTLLCAIVPAAGVAGAFVALLVFEVSRYLLSVVWSGADLVPPWAYWGVATIGGAIALLVVLANAPRLTYAEMRQVSPSARLRRRWSEAGEVAALGLVVGGLFATLLAGAIYSGWQYLETAIVGFPALTGQTKMVVSAVFFVLGFIGAILWTLYMLSAGDQEGEQ